MCGNNDRGELPARKSGFLWFGVLSLAIFLLASTRANAQAFQFDGGSSSLFQANGGAFHFYTSAYEGWLSAGYLNGRPLFGAFAQKQWHKYTFGAGDNSYQLRLPTDLFDGSHYFMGRGGSVAFASSKIHFSTFVGATSLQQRTPFFYGGDAETPIGYVSLDVKLNPKLNFFSRNIIAGRMTSISGLEFILGGNWKAAIAMGVGANQPYGAMSLSGDWRWFALKASYVAAGNYFQRAGFYSPYTTENERENITVLLRPTRDLTFSAGRFNLYQAPTKDIPAVSAVINQFSANARKAGFQFGSSLYLSGTSLGSSRGTSFNVGRSFTDRFQVSSSLFLSHSNHEFSSKSWTNEFREMISPRLSLLQFVTRSDGNTSFSWGGSFFSNPLSLDVTYQTVYSPFNPREPFHQVLLLSVRLQPFGSIQLNGSSFVTPAGSVKYTAYGSMLTQRGGSSAHPTGNFKFSKFIVAGRVVDEGGMPVAGAALRVKNDLVFSDSDGNFFLSVKKKRTFSLAVDLADFMTPEKFEVVSAPAEIASVPRDDASPLKIVLRRKATVARASR